MRVKNRDLRTLLWMTFRYFFGMTIVLPSCEQMLHDVRYSIETRSLPDRGDVHTMMMMNQGVKGMQPPRLLTVRVMMNLNLLHILNS